MTPVAGRARISVRTCILSQNFSKNFHFNILVWFYVRFWVGQIIFISHECALKYLSSVSFDAKSFQYDLRKKVRWATNILRQNSNIIFCKSYKAVNIWNSYPDLNKPFYYRHLSTKVLSLSCCVTKSPTLTHSLSLSQAIFRFWKKN